MCMNKQYLLSIVFTCLLSYSATAQMSIHRNFNTSLSEDSATAVRLEASLSKFLEQVATSSYTNEYVLDKHREKYSFFFDNLRGVNQNVRGRKFHKPTVLKSYTADGAAYFITVAFTGTRNEDELFFYKVVEFKAEPYKDHYRFYCPFEERIATFNSKKIENVTFYYRKTIDVAKAEKFAAFKSDLCKWTNTANNEIDYYNFESLDELLKTYGLLYDAAKCNFLCNDLGFADNNGKAYITGMNNEYYIFDYIGYYLYHNLPNKDKMYNPAVTGISTYYAGYGVLGDDMATLKKQFRAKLKLEPEIDFLEEFRKGRKSSVNRHFSHYVMAAFLYEEALNKVGFEKALSLVYTGKEGQQYFARLKELLGVDEHNFNATIKRLIAAG